MACTYLLTLDAAPTAPSLGRSLSVKERAQQRIEETIKELPADDHSLDDTHHNRTKPTLSNPQPISDTAGILNDNPASPLQPSPLFAPAMAAPAGLRGQLHLHLRTRNAM